MNLLNRWHNMISMPKYDEAWHRQDLAEKYNLNPEQFQIKAEQELR